MFDKGLVQIYTGDGKGKTTAAFGLAIRAAGHGGKVLIYQFLKPEELELGERKSVAGMAGITVSVLDRPWDMRNSFENASAVSKVRKSIADTLVAVTHLAGQKAYDVIILDEIVFCVNKNLASVEQIKTIIEEKDKGVELVLTGRGASEELMELADLVTEMKLVKHPFDKGVGARKGIEF